jgi:hypothetical protein
VIARSSVVAVLIGASVAFPPTVGFAAQERSSTLRVQGGALEFRASPGERDVIGVNEEPSAGAFVEVVVFEGAPVSVGPGCRFHPSLDFRGFRCFGVSSLDLSLGDRVDDVDLFGQDPSVVRGGSGRDALFGSGGDDTLIGGAGRDRLIGRAGADTLLAGRGNDVLDGFHAGNVGGPPSDPDDDALEGGPGRDFLFGGPASDRLRGGTGNDSLDGGGGSDVFPADPGADSIRGGGPHGRDTVDYSRRIRPVSVTDDGVANDGVLGEGDNVTFVADVRAGSGDDSVSTGFLRVFGNQGNDTLSSTAGGGAMFGGRGNDTLSVSGAPTVVRGEAGDDHLSTADGTPDVDRCGPGQDSVDADAADTVSSNCEDVTR